VKICLQTIAHQHPAHTTALEDLEHLEVLRWLYMQ